MDAFHVLKKVYTNNQMFSHFKPLLVHTNPDAWEQNIGTPSALFPSSVFFQTDCLSALCSNLKSVWLFLEESIVLSCAVLLMSMVKNIIIF